MPDIIESTGIVNSSTTETQKGVPTQSKFQFNVQNAWSNLFDIVNDSANQVRYEFVKSIKIDFLLLANLY